MKIDQLIGSEYINAYDCDYMIYLFYLNIITALCYLSLIWSCVDGGSVKLTKAWVYTNKQME